MGGFQRWQKSPHFIWLALMLWVIFLGGVAFFWNLGSIGLLDETEPLFSEAARMMNEQSDWVTPYFNGDRRFDKPPLIYWLVAIAYRVVGVNEWGARLPSAIAALGLTIFCVCTLRYFGIQPLTRLPVTHRSDVDQGAVPVLQQPNPWFAAWVGALILIFNPLTIGWARSGVSDMLLSGCMGSALLAFFWGYAQPSQSPTRSRWYFAFWVFSAFAVLTKGPIGIVLPALIIGAFLVLVGQLRPVLREIKLIPGFLVFLAIAVPWYVLVTLANGEDYIDSFFGYHNFERFTRVVNNHSAPWFFHVIVILIGFAPWSVHLPIAIARFKFWRVQDWRHQPRSAHLGLFALCWLVGILAFFTVAATKLPSYMVPAIPAAAMLTALFWSSQIAHPTNQLANWLSNLFNILLLIALGGLILYSIRWMGTDPAMPNLPEAVRQSHLLVIGSSIFFTAAAAIGVLLLLRQAQWVWLVNGLGISLFFVLAAMPGLFLIDAQRQLPLRELAATILQVREANEPIVMVGYRKPSLVFYTQHEVKYLESPEVPRYVRRRAREEKQKPTALVLGYPRQIRQMNLPPEQYQQIDQSGVYELVRVNLRAKN